VLLMPATPTTAPADLTMTGDPIFQAPWTSCGLPVLNIPTGLDSSAQPYAIQLVGQGWDEETLLRTGSWIERTIRKFAAVVHNVNRKKGRSQIPCMESGRRFTFGVCPRMKSRDSSSPAPFDVALFGLFSIIILAADVVSRGPGLTRARNINTCTSGLNNSG